MSDRSLPTGWYEATLGGLASYLNGYAFKPTDWSKHGLPIVRIAHMTDSTAECDHYEGQLPDRFRVRPGDLLFSWSATLSTLIWDRPEAYVNQHIYKVVPSPDVALSFLRHLLDFNMPSLAGQSHGTTMRHIKRRDLLPFPVKVPPRNEQHQIAEVLDTVDAAIRRTEQVIAKLELVKKGLLNDLLTRGIDENGELRDPERHPEQFKESELGRIHQEWEKVPLGQVLQDLYRYPTYYGIEYVEDGVPEIRGELLRDDGTISKEPTLFRYVSEQTARNFPRVRLNENDFVMSVRGTIGKVARVRKSLSGAVITANLLKLRFDPTLIVPAWAEVYLLSPAFQQALDLASSATTIKTIQVPRLSAILLARPPREEQVRIAEVCSTVTDRICAEQADLDKLRLLKKALMDDLLTGKVRVTPLLEKEKETAASEAAE